MSVLRRRVLSGLALVLVAGAALWVNANFERVAVEVEGEPRGEARYDDFLAARRLFESLGAPLRVTPAHQRLPPDDGTLLLLDRADERPAGRAEAVLDWARRGGHAVVLARPGIDDPLLAPWGLTLSRPDPPQATVTASLPPGETLQVEVAPRYVLTHDDGEPIARAGGHALVFRHGRGLVTAIAGDGFMRNREIGKADNAAFLWRLAHLQRGGEVWIVTDARAPPLWLPMLARGWPLAVSLLALLLALAWSASRRFGPAIPEPVRTPPRLLGHIAASGRFLWRHGAGAVLLQAVRDSVLRSIEFRRPGWLAGGTRDERLARLAELPRAQVHQAFERHEVHERGAFTDVITTLETIRKRL